MSLTNAPARLYEALDTLTGDLPEFLKTGRDDTWELPPYEQFNVTSAGDSVLFGFRTQINGDSCPDPQIMAWIDLEARTATIRSVDTLTRYFQTPDLPGGSDVYAIELIEEMQRRWEENGDMQRRVGGGV